MWGQVDAVIMMDRLWSEKSQVWTQGGGFYFLSEVPETAATLFLVPPAGCSPFSGGHGALLSPAPHTLDGKGTRSRNHRDGSDKPSLSCLLIASPLGRS